MQSLDVSALDTTRDTIEVVERKGLGHPDTICDALAETLSQNLCREYRRRFGEIFHHNVDKALLCGGRAKPNFGGGSVLAPITIYLAGRATANVGNEIVKIKDIAIDGSRSWLRRNLHARLRNLSHRCFLTNDGALGRLDCVDTRLESVV